MTFARACAAQSITLVFEDFLTVFDDDFLVVRDGTRAVLPGDTQVRRAIPPPSSRGQASSCALLRIAPQPDAGAHRISRAFTA